MTTFRKSGLYCDIRKSSISLGRFTFANCFTSRLDASGAMLIAGVLLVFEDLATDWLLRLRKAFSVICMPNSDMRAA
jgi:hypothetical protein